MASHHHHACSRRHNHNNQIPLVVPTSPRCFTYRDSPPCCCTHSNHPCPPPPPDHLHLLASYLQTHQQETHFPNQTCSCNHKNLPRQQDDQVILSCLLQKINNLESSLNKFAPFYDQRRDRYSTSLRDSAARVIQTHFRSYLVYRSISFRHLKELAVIKSSFLSLKSSVSGKPVFPFKVASRKATDLLLQLDSIQGRVDPMIRSSKRSLSRDLVRFLQYIDDCVVRRYGYISKSAANVSFLGSSHSKKPQAFGVAEDRRVEKVFVTCDGDEELDSTTDDSEEVLVDERKTGSSKFSIVKGNVVKPTVRKTMVFDKNRNAYQVYGKTSAEDTTVERLRNRMGKVFVTCDGDEDSSAELEELDSTTDGGEELPVGSTDKRETGSSKFRNGATVKGNVVKLPVRRTMVLDKNRTVYGNKHDVTSSEEDDSVDSGEEETLVISRDSERNQHGLKARSVVVVNGKNRVVKTVKFDEDGNVYKVYGDTPEESISEEEDDSASGSNDGNGGDKRGSVNEVEEIKYVPKEKEGFEEEDEEETQSENEVSSSDGSEGEAIDANNTGSNEHTKREIEVQKGSLMFSPPLPLKMEP